MTVASHSISEQTLNDIRTLYEHGMYLQAYRLGQEFGSLKDWTGPAERVMAARLLGQLGAPRRSLWHRLRAWRESPEHAEVRYYYGWTILEHNGPYDTWLFLKEQGDLPDAADHVRSSWYALHAQVAAALRDFDRADEWLDHAQAVGADRPWIHVTRSGVFQMEDRYADALAAADEALSIQPWFRPAVQTRAHLLMLLERDDEAFEFLQQAAEQIECAALHWQLSAIHFEREAYEQSQSALDRFEEMSPLLERSFGQAFHSLRSFLAYLAGDDEAAIAWALKCGSADERQLVERLADPDYRDRLRVTLPVGFTRQHHLTCVPATLATVSRFWSKPAEHLKVAEEICYDGTSAFAERQWAAESGWAVREFSVTEQAAHRLIDAGIPFTLTTTDPGSAHLQAVIGYDGRRGSLIIRDPYLRYRREVRAEEFLKHYRGFGPRGMALAPQAESARLERLELPDCELWDEMHVLDTALTSHRREEAAAIVVALESRVPDHFLTLHARRRLALYDANPHDELTATNKLLEQFPDNTVFQLTRLSLLRNLARREERFNTLRELASKPDSDTAFVLQYAQELAQDAREHERALSLLRDVIRMRCSESGAYYVLGNVLWERQEFDQALELYRFAACLDDKSEPLAEAYFRAAQHRRQTNMVLDWLRRRFQRFGAKSSWPARTLDWALCCLERTTEALEVLDEAMRLRPDDGELRLYAASSFGAASSEHAEHALNLLEQAQGKCPRPYWLRVAAQLAWHRGELHEALRLFREVLQLQPFAMQTHSSVARLLAETEGRQAALDHLRATVDRFPHHEPLLQLWINWLDEEPPEAVEPVVRRLLELNPTEAWAVRQLGFLLVKQGRWDEAETCAAEAGRLEPTSVAWHHLRGEIRAAQGRLADAREEYRAAVRLSVDNEYAIGQLLACCDTVDQRREALEFVRQELVRQMILGDGLLAYRNFAHGVLAPDELLASLQEALAARPDLWHAWSACVQQHIAMEHADEADRLARQAVERFPLLPRMWLDLSEVCRVRSDLDGQQEALETAHRINPAWGEAVRQLSEIYQRRGDLPQARSLLESAVSRDPLDGTNRGWLAEVLWKQDARDEALEQIERAVTLEPGYQWAWDQLCDWSAQADQPDRPEHAARQLVQQKPGAARSWLILARVLDRDECLDERLRALQKAAELNPRCIDAYDQHARLLALVERYDEALAAVRPTHVWGEQLPAQLLARAAWIEWVRGNHQDAVAQMQSALAADPAMSVGWQTLADWCRELGDDASYLDAAKQMVRLFPYSETTLGYYAEALAKSGQRDAAKATFRRAFDVQPEYSFAGLWLFDLQLEDGELDDATVTLDTLIAHDDGPFPLARSVQLAARRRDVPAAEKGLKSLCLNSGDETWPLQAALTAMRDADWEGNALEILQAMLSEQGVAPEVGRLWANLRIDRRHWLSQERLAGLLESGPVGETAVYGWIEGLLRSQKLRRLRRFLAANADWLRTNTFTWGAVVWGWTSLRDWDKALEMGADWRKFPEAKPWMLVNVVEAFRAKGRDAEAAEVSRHAVSLEPSHGQHLHHLWLACDHVIVGDYAEAAARLESTAPNTLDQEYGLLYLLAKACVDITAAEPADRPAAFKAIRRRIKAAMSGYTALRFEPARRRFYLHTVEHVARHTATTWARLWAWWCRATSA